MNQIAYKWQMDQFEEREEIVNENEVVNEEVGKRGKSKGKNKRLAKVVESSQD